MRVRRLGLAGAVLIAILVGLAGPASAHAQLLGTSPANNAVLATSPPDVLLNFGESVQAPPTAVEVYNASGSRIATGPPRHPGGHGDEVEITLPAGLRGTYIVSWRVISADTHPVQGAFTFSVGAVSSTDVGALEQHLLAGRHPSRAVGLLVGTLRTLLLLAVIVVIGGLGLLVTWPGGIEIRALRRSVIAAAFAAGLGSVAAVIVQAPYDAGKPLADAFQSNVLSPVIHSSFGHGAGLRIAGAIVVLGAILAGHRMRESRRTWPPRPWLLTGLAGGTATDVSLSLSGHATTGRWEPWGFLVDLIHVAAGSLWIGGLIVVAAVLLTEVRRNESFDATALVRRFSTTAAWAVAVIVASGVFEAWRQLGGWKALTTSDYGTLLSLKVLAVVAAVEAGWFSRRWIHHRYQPVGPGAVTASRRLAPPPKAPEGGRSPATPRFWRWLAFEALLGLGVVVLTGALIDSAPPQSEHVAAAARSYSASTRMGADIVSVAVHPLVPGTATVAVQVTDQHTHPINPFQVTASLSLPSKGIGPLAVPLTRDFTGNWVADNIAVPVGGEWRLSVSLLTDPVTEIDHSFAFRIYG